MGTLDAREERVSRRGGGLQVPHLTAVKEGLGAWPYRSSSGSGLRAREGGSSRRRWSQAPEPKREGGLRAVLLQRETENLGCSQQEEGTNREQVSPRTADAGGDDPADS